MTKATAKSKRIKLTSRMAPKEKGNDIFLSKRWLDPYKSHYYRGANIDVSA